MRRSVLRVAIPLAIVTGLTACDNVSWEGVDLELRAPPEHAPDPEATPDDPGDEEEAPPPDLDQGAFVYLVERVPGEDDASLMPVAEWRPQTGELAALPEDLEPEEFQERFAYNRFQPGEEFVLLAGGYRAGTFIGDGDVEPGADFCPARPVGGGRTELASGASDHDRFLAVRKEDFGTLEFGDLPPGAPGADLEEAAETAAGPLMMEYEAPWPPSMGEIRQALRMTELPPAGDPVMAATFIFGDDLTLGEASGNAYALFFLARQEGGEGAFRAVHSSYRRQDQDGKAWPDPVDFLPWSALPGGEAQQGLGAFVVRSVGEDARWFYALEPDEAGGQWEMTFRDPCEPYVEE